MPNTEEIIKEVAQKEESRDKKIEETIQLVVFELDKEEYGVEIVELQEIIRMPEITPVPNSPQFIKGIFNLRGKIIVVVDLEKRFHLVRENAGGAGNIIIAEVDKNNFGVIVDKVTEILNIPKSNIQKTPALVSSKIEAEYLKGVVVIEKGSDNGREKSDNREDNDVRNSSRLIILLDLPKLLQEKELLSLGKTVQEVSK